MGFLARQKSRPFHLIAAVMAAIGLEFDVVCNPFAPTLIIHWIMSSHAVSQTNPTTESWDSDLLEWTYAIDERGDSGEDDDESTTTEERSHYCLTPDISEAIAVRPPGRSPFPILADACFLISSPASDPIVQGREADGPITARLSIQSRLCRFRC